MNEDLKQRLIKLGLDVDSAVRRFMDDENMFLKYLLRFEKERSYSDMIEALKNKEMEKAFKAAHSFKGVCGNLSMEELYKLACRQVEILRENQLDGLEENTELLSREYKRVVTGIRKCFE